MAENINHWTSSESALSIYWGCSQPSFLISEDRRIKMIKFILMDAHNSGHKKWFSSLRKDVILQYKNAYSLILQNYSSFGMKPCPLWSKWIELHKNFLSITSLSSLGLVDSPQLLLFWIDEFSWEQVLVRQQYGILKYSFLFAETCGNKIFSF